jgi:glycosyltransferase involved in cell wall biosynthesis
MISVVVPAYNESLAIAETVLQIRQALASFEHEVVVVDDGSKDDTASVAGNAGARVIQQIHNLGYGAALKAGIRAAKFDTIVITDADGTYPNDAMPELIAEYRKGFNMVVGARRGDHYRESFVKAPLRKILKWLVEFTTGRGIPDVNSGLRVFSRSEIIPYFDTLCDTFSFTTSVTLAYMMTAKFVSYVPITYNRRVGQTKVRLLRDSLRTLQYIVQAILYYNPLKLFLLICGVLGAISVLSFAAASQGYTPALYVGAVSLLMTIPVFCFGLLAELLKQIMVRR